MESYDFSNLQKKLLDKSASKTETVTATATPKAASLKKVDEKKVVQAPAVKAVAKPEAKVVAPAVIKPVVEKKVETVAKTVAPTPDAVSFGDAAVGITLGIVPYLLLPAVAFNAAKGLVKKPKPLPVEPAPKVIPYSKSLGEGIKEGLAEFAAGKISPDVRKALQLSAIGFGTAIGLTAVSVIINPSGEVKEAPAVKVAPKETPKSTPKPAATTKATPAVKVAPVTKPAPVPTPAPKVEPAPAPKPVPVPEPAPAPKVAPVPEPAPAPKVAPVPEPAPAPKPVPVPEPAPAPKVAPAPVAPPAPKAAAGDEVVEVYKAPAVSADNVDLSALKSLRKSKSSN